MKLWLIYHRLVWYPSTCMHVLIWKSHPIHWVDVYILGDHQSCELGGDTKDFECIVFFGIFGNRVMLQVEGGASKMCEVLQCWDYPKWGADGFMQRTWLDKMHAYAKACWTNSIFTSTTNNVLKGEGTQWRVPYVNLMRWTHGKVTPLSSWEPCANKVCYPYIICHRYFFKLCYFSYIYTTIDSIFCIFFWIFLVIFIFASNCFSSILHHSS